MIPEFRTLVAILAAVLVAGCGQGDAPQSQGATAGGDDRRPVIVLGVDGAEWDVIEQMVAAGELPGFRTLMDEGAHGHLMNMGPQVSPVVWTTFATGHFPRQHGILDFVYPYQEGAKQPVDASLRRVPALWNLMDEAGKTSTVIGYFVSHPAEPINGRIVTDRALSGLERSVWPPELESRVREIADSVRSGRSELVEQFLGWPYAPDQAEDESSRYHEAAEIVRGRIDGRVVSDTFIRQVTSELIAQQTDLFISYFRLPDIVSHSVWYYHDSSDWDTPPDPEMVELLGEVIPDAYRFVDEVLQEILETHGGSANILVISDHGFGSGTGRFKGSHPSLTGNHRANGVVLAHGPDFAQGSLEPMTIMEIFPTLAYLLGLPISDAIPGSIQHELLSETFTSEVSAEFVDRYDLDWNPVDSVETGREAQQEEMESLRGLGYIGEGVSLSEDSASGDFDFWSVEPQLLVRSLHAEIAYHLIRDDVAAAEEIISLVAARAPERLPELEPWVRAKIEWFRSEVPGAEDIAPNAEDFYIRLGQADSN